MPEFVAAVDKQGHLYWPPDEIFALEEGAQWIVDAMNDLQELACSALKIEEGKFPASKSELDGIEAEEMFYWLHTVNERVSPRTRYGVEWDRDGRAYASRNLLRDFSWLFDRARAELRGVPTFNGECFTSTIELAHALGIYLVTAVSQDLRDARSSDDSPLWKCMSQPISEMSDLDTDDAIAYLDSNLQVVAAAILRIMPATESFECDKLRVEIRREACVAWQIYERHGPEPIRGGGLKSNPQEPSLDHAGFYSAAEIAAEFGLSQPALEARLRRFRIGNDDGWHEIADAKPREPKFRYRLGAIASLIEKLRGARISKA
jgi:hypothetical protein